MCDQNSCCNPFKLKYLEMWPYEEAMGESVYYRNSKGDMALRTDKVYSKRKWQVIKSMSKKDLLCSFPEILKGYSVQDSKSDIIKKLHHESWQF